MSVDIRIRKAFDGFTLDVAFAAGDETVGLLGASGCGKSMTLRCIAGIVRPDEGRIVVNGRTLFDSAQGIDLPPQKRNVGLLFQNYALFPNMTVEQNIRAVLALGQRPDVEGRLRSLLERFYITGLERHYPAQLSGGQQQRVALARIMASEPSIIMLDEPLSALDSYLRWQLEGELQEILEAFGGTTLFVSHDRDEVYRLCRSVCVVSEGRNEPVRSVRALFESPGTLASSLLSGCKNYSRAERVGAHRIRALDWNVELACAEEAGPGVRYVGVRAHYVAPVPGGVREAEENVFACDVLRVTEDVFGTIVNLRPVASTSAGDFSRIRMELSKEAAASIRAGDRIAVRLSPKDLLLLRE